MFNEEKPIIIISNNEKDYIRNNILNGVLNCINKKNLKILKQLTQSIKKILNFDFEKIWKDNFISTVIEFLDSNDQLKVYSGIVIYHQLSKIYQHEREERKKIFRVFITLFHYRFKFFNNLFSHVRFAGLFYSLNYKLHFMNILKINYLFTVLHCF